MEDNNKRSPLVAQNKRKINFENEKSKFRAVTEEIEGQQVRVLKGYPILFDVYGKPWRGSKWVEKIDKNALATVDLSKLVILYNHDTSLVLGRAGKNLTAVIDDIGLFVTVTLGNTFVDDFVYDRVQRELVDGMSFHFDNDAMIASDWTNKIDVVTKINEIYEVSIVTFPAYEETVIITDDKEEITPSSDEMNLACPNCTCPKGDKPCVTCNYNCSDCDTCTCPMAKVLGNTSNTDPEEEENKKQALLNLIETM